MPKAVVLGGGLVGSLMAADLARDGQYSVTVVDRDEERLSHSIARAQYIGGQSVNTAAADLSRPDEITRVVADADIVVGALSSLIGFNAMRTVIEAGKSYCDICFMPEDAGELDALAKQHGVTVVPDCGVAPGMSNLFAGYAASHFDRCDAIEIYVGGLPLVRQWPFEYKAAFSPYDVIEEYTRPARLVELGEVVTRPALSEPELMKLPVVGTVEAFNTDGLRSLVRTLNVPDMKEKTLRYPGHIEIMRVFRETGLFSHDPVDVNGVSVRPIDLIQKLMFPMWEYESNEGDLTVMRVIARGHDDGRDVEQVWDLYDEYEPSTGATSMSRTTAYPCTIVANMICDGTFTEPGVHFPEELGKSDAIVSRLLEELGDRGVRYEVSRS